MNLVPRNKNKYSVIPLTESAYYWLTGNKGIGYGVFKDEELLYSSIDIYEASYFFDEATHGL